MFRRLLSIVLFAATVLPAIMPVLLHGAAKSSVPMCCRRDGAHHCNQAMGDALMAVAVDAGRKLARAPRMICPYQQRAVGATQIVALAGATDAAELAGVLREPAAAARAECLRRVSYDRSRQKRGPPATPLS